MRYCPPRAVIGFVVLLALAALAHALTFPQLTGRIVDEANILDAATRQALTDKLAAVEAKSGDQIVVVTLRSLQDTSIEDYGYQLGRHWGIGQKGTNNGALLIVAPNERKVRIEVGYGLEGALTDAVTRLIIQNAILPRFRAGDFQGGVARGVDDIVQVVSGDAEEFKRRAAQRPENTAKGVDIVTLILIAFVLFAIFSAMRGSGPGGAARGCRRSGYAGPIFIPSGGSWSSGSSGSSAGSAEASPAAAGRSAAAVLRAAGDDTLGRRPRTHHRGHPAGGNAHVRRNLLRLHTVLERLPRVPASLGGRGRAADAAAADLSHRLASRRDLCAAARGLSRCAVRPHA